MQRRRLVVVACCFAAVACAFVGIGQGATINLQTFAKGSDFVFGNSAVMFTASSGDLLNQPPLQAAQEVEAGGQSDTVFAAGGGTYSSTLAVDSREIVKSDTKRQVQMDGPGSFTESAFYFGAGNSFTGNASPCDINATLLNGTYPYNELSYVTGSFSGSALKYQSTIGLSALAVEQPDSLTALMQASGEGYGSIHTGVLSEIGFDCNTTVGYQQAEVSDIMAGGNYEIGTAFQFTSFRDTFQYAELPV